MNTAVTSREQILAVACRLSAQEGPQALNIRQVAAQCGISVGSVYNYFPSKADLSVAVLESIWHSIFHGAPQIHAAGSFRQAVQQLFLHARKGTAAYPAFFSSHGAELSTPEKEKGRARMQQYFAHMEQGLLAALRQDAAVHADAFGPVLTQEAFVHFVLQNLVALLQTQAEDCDVLLEIIARVTAPGTAL